MMNTRHELNALDIAHHIGVAGDQLVTRPLGERFRAYLETCFQERSTDCCIISFAGVRLIDSSFADEVFGVLAAERSRHVVSRPCLVLRELSAVSRENLDMALLSRPARQPGLRNCVLPVLVGTETLELAGKAEEHVRQTFAALLRHDQLTARELADEEALEIVAASTRLKVLFNLGVACREETRDGRGRLYIYHLPR